MYYEDSIGVEKDYEKGISWYTKAAEQGNTDAQTQLQFLKTTISVQ
ncbi:MAG: SEL1-like repeat protein [Euryarchaeota archaeon]|nr:SEL1-like repeat protein [Euryarchaeota archaeon]